MVTKVKDFRYERADIKGAEAFVEKATKRVKKAKTAEEIVGIRNEVNAVMNTVSTHSSLSYIRHSLNVREKFYEDEQNYYDEFLPPLWAKVASFDKAIVSSPHAAELEKLLGSVLMENMRAEARVTDDKIVPDLVEENKLVSEYDRLLAELTFPWEGKALTLSEITKHTKAENRETRKKAFTVIGETLEGISDKLDALYDKLVKVRTAMAKKMGFDDFVEMGDLRIGHVGYGRKEIAVFRESTLKYAVPALKALKDKLAVKLGIEGGMHIYDNNNYISGGNIDPVGTAEDLFKAAQAMYDDMDKGLGAFFKEMCEAEAIDYVSRDGKMTGGYAELLYGFGQPFIFANFNGTMDDVGVLTHEFGHAYAFKRAYVNRIDPTVLVGGMETAETHSMSMEQLANKYNDKFYGANAKKATYQQVFDAFSFLPYGVIVDVFQEIVYKNPDMTPEGRKSLWLELESAFRPYLDMSDVPYINKGGRWQYQRHIYEVPFYYIDYCLSTVMALQFGVLAETDYDAALRKYLNLVEAGGTKSLSLLAHEAGFVSPFDNDSLKTLCEDVSKYINRLEEVL